MADISIPWIFRLLNSVLGPLADIFRIRPKLYVYLDNLRARTIPAAPTQTDFIIWEGELVIKNNSKFDAYDLKFLAGDNLFDHIDKLDKHNHLVAKGELRLRFSWSRQYERIRRKEIKSRLRDNRFPSDKNDFSIALKYDNEKGKAFYSVFTVQDKKDETKLYVFKPKP
jgi:hypothetical protein